MFCGIASISALSLIQGTSSDVSWRFKASGLEIPSEYIEQKHFEDLNGGVIEKRHMTVGEVWTETQLPANRDIMVGKSAKKAAGPGNSKAFMLSCMVNVYKAQVRCNGNLSCYILQTHH